MSGNTMAQPRRRWTAQDQTVAEVAAACGVSIRDIGRMLGFSETTPRNNLIMGLKEKSRAYAVEHGKSWRKANRERLIAQKKAYYWANKEKLAPKRKEYRDANKERIRNQHRAYYLANRETVLLKNINWYYANKDRAAARRKAYYEANRENLLARAKEWHKANREHALAKQAAYRQANRDRINAQQRAKHKANPESKRVIDHAYYQANKEKVLSNVKAWRNANRNRRREICRQYSSRKRSANRRALSPVTRSVIDTRFALWRNRCAFCGVDAKHPRNAGHDRLTVEHILALTQNGLDEADNIAPACHSCNCSKNNAPVEAWYRRQAFFTEARWRKICRHCPGAVIGQLPLAMPPADTEAA